MNSETLTAFVRHPKRCLIVIIGTFVIILVIVWPVVDDYYNTLQEKSDLQSQFAMSQLRISTIGTMEKKLSQSEAELSKLEAQTVSDRTIDEFRKLIVQTVRQAGCRVNKLHVKPTASRRWHFKDHPIKPISVNLKGGPTPYNLTSTLISMSVSGRMENLSSLLRSIRETDKFIHSQRFSLRSIGGKRNELILDIDLQLFGFTKSELSAT